VEQVANQQAYPYNLFPEADQLSLTYSNRYSPKGPKPLLIPVKLGELVVIQSHIHHTKYSKHDKSQQLANFIGLRHYDKQNNAALAVLDRSTPNRR
jgi:hypothetical protein